MLQSLRKSVGGVLSHVSGLALAAGRHRRYDRLASDGLSPFVHIVADREPLDQRTARARLAAGHLRVPNVSGFYHGILREAWERYGLGARCLLTSETRAVGHTFRERYPETDFVTTDFYLDLQPNPECDVVWDLCARSVPPELHGFSSVLCQATLEHIQDPVQVMRNLTEVLTVGGHLYVQTHTPAFHYHAYPRDYLRYFPDWFIDVPQTLGNIVLVELLCVDGHAFATYRRSA